MVRSRTFQLRDALRLQVAADERQLLDGELAEDVACGESCFDGVAAAKDEEPGGSELAESWQTLLGSFSAVSKPNVASK